MNASQRFDEAYYRRHYTGRRRVHTAREIDRLARGVTGLAGWFGVPLEWVLDVGAGPGLWRDWFRRHHPRVAYRSTDVSPYACARYGHERRDISRWRARQRFDLIVCQGVLQYLDERAAARAIDNLGRWCDGALYLEALTARDWRHNCDRSRTDGDVHLRSGDWYRRRLAKHFLDCGGGLFCSRRAGVTLFELEGS